MEKNLGHATAYGYAKSKGYSGTEEEFAELMADYASVGQSAAQSAEQAAASATSASGSADTASQAAQTATSKASEAVTAADTATTKASEASTSAQSASQSAESASTSAQTATTAATTATTKASEASESATTATTAKTDAETARDAAAQSASEAAESARTLTIDATLTQAGQAADSKAVGDRFVNIGYTVAISNNLLNPSKLEAGRITSSSSSVLHTGSYDTDYRTTDFMPVESGKKYGFYYKPSGNNINNFGVANIWAYDDDKEAVSYVGSVAANNDGTTYITAPANASYIRASIVTAIATTYGLLQFSETDGTAPEDIVEYFNKTYLDGYTKKDEFDTLKADVDSIEESFADIYRDLTGTITSSKYIKANGTITDVSSDNYKILTIQVAPAKKYKITGKAYYNSYYYAFYDENGDFISGLKATESGTTSVYEIEAIAPKNAKTLVAASVDGTQNIMGVVGKASTNCALWTDKKWVVFGDSITEVNARTTKHYFDYVSKATGITTYNMGNSGSGYAREQDIGTAFYQRISAVPTDADVITIFGSLNDLGAEIPLGTANDTGTTTLGGCVNATFDNLFAAFPLANVGVVTPTPWDGANPTNEPNSASEYVQLIKDICNKRGIPCLDLFHCSALRPWEASFRELAYSKDGGAGCHPDETGHKIIAPRFKAFLETLLM